MFGVHGLLPQRFRVVFQRSRSSDGDDGAGASALHVDAGSGTMLSVYDDWTQLQLDRVGSALFKTSADPTSVRTQSSKL